MMSIGICCCRLTSLFIGVHVVNVSFHVCVLGADETGNSSFLNLKEIWLFIGPIEFTSYYQFMHSYKL